MEIFPALVCPARWDKLMVCTDGSDEGQNAVAVTLELARACGSQVQVVQVVVPEYQGPGSELGELLVAEVQQNMEAIRAAAARLDVALQPLTPESRLPHAAIVAEAEKGRPDLLILGRRGKSSLTRLLMGSVTAQVIGHSPVNVLVLPRGAALAFQRLLVASDGSPYSDAACRLALALARGTGSQLYAVAVAPKKGDLDVSRETIQKLQAAAKQAGLPLKNIKGVAPQGVAPDAGIVQQASDREVDLIIMGSHGRTGLKKLLMGSTTEKVIGHAPCPVLVVKAG